jgi:hypothetical protein
VVISQKNAISLNKKWHSQLSLIRDGILIEFASSLSSPSAGDVFGNIQMPESANPDKIHLGTWQGNLCNVWPKTTYQSMAFSL